MAILKGLIRKLNGSAGDFTFKQLNGQTVVSEKVTNVTNKRTTAQMKHRMKWANMVKMYKGISPLLLSAFEGKAQGVSDYNMFMKVNINVSPVYLTKAEVAGGACIAAPYQLSQGTLPSIVISGEGSARKTDIALGALSISDATTVKEFSDAVVANNANFDYGDQISFFLITQKTNEVTGIPYCQFAAYAVTLDKESTAKLWDNVLSAGYSDGDSDGKKVLAADVSAYGDCVYSWVHSRKTSSKTCVSTQFLMDNNSILASYTSDDAYEAASKSYGDSKDVFLDPSEESENVNSVTPEEETPSTYTVSLAASPAAGGSVTGAGSYTAGSTANISASANSGYAFVRWSDGDTNASRSVTVNSDLDLTATFTSSDTENPDIVH